MSVKKDWTQDAAGIINNLPAYHRCVDTVKEILECEASHLWAGRNTPVARLIVARLAHQLGLRPAEGSFIAAESDPPASSEMVTDLTGRRVDLVDWLRREEADNLGNEVSTGLLRFAADAIQRRRDREAAILEWARSSDPHDVGIGDLEEFLEGKRQSLEVPAERRGTME